MPSFLTPLIADPAAAVCLVDEHGVIIADRVEAAFASATRRRGLLGRDAIESGTALIIAPCNAVHTCFMRFPIDVIFVARDGRVTRVRRALPAWRLAASFAAFATIEMAAGQADAAALRPGVRLALRAFHAGPV